MNGLHYVGLMFSTIFSLHKMATELAFKGKRVLVSILSSSHKYGTLDKTPSKGFLIQKFLRYFYMDLNYGDKILEKM